MSMYHIQKQLAEVRRSKRNTGIGNRANNNNNNNNTNNMIAKRSNSNNSNNNNSNRNRRLGSGVVGQENFVQQKRSLAMQQQQQQPKRQPLQSLNRSISYAQTTACKLQMFKPVVKQEQQQQQQQQQPLVQHEQEQQQHQQIQQQQLLASVNELPEGVTDVDKSKGDHCIMVGSYVKEIFTHLYAREQHYSIGADFMESQIEVTPRMRRILVDWLQQLCRKFKLQLDTYYLCVRLLDRFLAVDNSICKNQLQLLGASVLWLASKMEEVYCIDINDLIFYCNNAYTKRELLQMEIRVLSMLDFDLLPPLCITFLRRYSKVAQVDNKVHHIAKFLLEISTLHSQFTKWRQSELAAAALHLALGAEGGVWCKQLQFYSGYNTHSLQTVIADLAACVQSAHTVKEQSALIKYRSAAQFCASAHPQLQPQSQFLLNLICPSVCKQ